jgi:Holliday junction resolvasome RuvABC endonuclease subunit
MKILGVDPGSTRAGYGLIKEAGVLTLIIVKYKIPLLEYTPWKLNKISQATAWLINK